MGISRNTKSVKTLLDTFNEQNEAISVVQLVNNLKEEMNKTTVYRALDRMEKEGLLHSFTGQGGLKWYAKCKSGCDNVVHNDIHPHFQCSECGKTKCFPVDVSIPMVKGYTVSSAEVLLIGQCPDCIS